MHSFPCVCCFPLNTNSMPARSTSLFPLGLVLCLAAKPDHRLGKCRDDSQPWCFSNQLYIFSQRFLKYSIQDERRSESVWWKQQTYPLLHATRQPVPHRRWWCAARLVQRALLPSSVSGNKRKCMCSLYALAIKLETRLTSGNKRQHRFNTTWGCAEKQPGPAPSLSVYSEPIAFCITT